MNIESLAANPFVSLGSLALGALGVILAIIFYVRSQKNKIPCFAYASNTLVEGLNKALDGLEVHYKGEAQERLTITKLVFWNDGKETIDRRDLIKSDPLRISCPNDLDILDVQIISSNTERNSIEIGPVEVNDNFKTYPIFFEYLDHNESFVVQLIHGGDASVKFSVKGKIKGVHRISSTADAREPLKIIKYIPFGIPFEALFTSPLFFKYIGSLTYLSFAFLAAWYLINGNTQWYVWLAIPILLLFSAVMYFNFRRIPPVKI